MKNTIRKNSFIYLIAALLTILFFSTISDAKASDVKREEDKISYRKKTSIDFSDINITGELVKPEGAYVGVRKNIRFKNFIKVRSNFRHELFDSEDNI